MTLQIEDLKVFTANFVCMALLRIESINTDLQTVLFLATIVYTIIRIANEIKKFNRNGKADNNPTGDKDNQA